MNWHSARVVDARGTPCGIVDGVIGSLEVEPSFLARVHAANLDQADAEMRKLVRRARGNHALFHV